MKVDTVVVGAGTAGLVAAGVLAERGRRVVLVAKGAGSTRLAPGTVDVLGYDPSPVSHPASALGAFVDSRPEHPYARVGLDTLGRAVEWLRDRVECYRYVGTLEDNFLLPTAIGAAKPTAIVPETMAAGDVRNGGRFLLCGLRGFKDFYPALAADNLTASAKVEARGVELHPPLGGEADVGSLAFANRFDHAEFRQAVVRDTLAAMEGEDAVGFPAVLGRSRPAEVWSALQDALGRPVFEIPTLPPSVPGIRLFEALESVLIRAGTNVMIGSEVVAARSSGRRVDGLWVQTSARRRELEADTFVLATGGILSGGIVMGSDDSVRETVLGLPVRGVPPDHESMFSTQVFGDHPLSPAGLAVDDHLRPVDQGGDLAYENVYAAGALLGGATPWKELSGEGISLGSGFKAAEEILG